MNDSPAFESRRVRTQPRTVTRLPIGRLSLQQRGDVGVIGGGMLVRILDLNAIHSQPRRCDTLDVAGDSATLRHV